jgi:hypothetical protein
MDLTPVTSIRFESVDTSVGNFDQVHTCRDLGNLREWMVDRLQIRGSQGAKPHDMVILLMKRHYCRGIGLSPNFNKLQPEIRVA